MRSFKLFLGFVFIFVSFSSIAGTRSKAVNATFSTPSGCNSFSMEAKKQFGMNSKIYLNGNCSGSTFEGTIALKAFLSYRRNFYFKGRFKSLITSGHLYDYGNGPVIKGHVGNIDSKWSRDEQAQLLNKCQFVMKGIKRLVDSSRDITFKEKSTCHFSGPEILEFAGYIPPSIDARLKIKIKK